MNLCVYYQAHVVPQEAWFFVGVLRSFEHLCFDRTLEKERSIFEFFVPSELEASFVHLMTYFQNRGIVVDLKKLPNRLADAQAVV
jgi:hypothetical protein